MQPPELTLTVTPNELDGVMTGLALLPWGQVNGLIQKLLNQANSQNAQVGAAEFSASPLPAEPAQAPPQPSAGPFATIPADSVRLT